MPVPLPQKIKEQKKLIADLSKRWNLAIKTEQTFNRNGIISDMKGRTKAVKEVAKCAKKYEDAVLKLHVLEEKNST